MASSSKFVLFLSLHTPRSSRALVGHGDCRTISPLPTRHLKVISREQHRCPEKRRCYSRSNIPTILRSTLTDALPIETPTWLRSFFDADSFSATSSEDAGSSFIGSGSTGRDGVAIPIETGSTCIETPTWLRSFLDTGPFSGITNNDDVVNAPSSFLLDKPVPSEQVQLPLPERVMRAIYEECVPWLLTLVIPVTLTLLTKSPVPLYSSLLAEITFFIVLTSKILTNFSKPTYPEPLLPSRSWQNLRDNVWSSQTDVSARREFLMGWFYDSVPFSRLRYEDALPFIAWLRYGMLEEQLTASQLEELEREDMAKLEREVNDGRTLPRRSAGEEPIPCLRFNLEPMRYRHKPLAFYGITHALKELLTVALSGMGFEYRPPQDGMKELGYWYRPAREGVVEGGDGTEVPTPLVFVHGVGGLVFYYQMIERLAEKIEQGSGAAMILFDLPFISLRMSDDIPSITDQIESVCRTMDETVGEGVKATFVGHSFGSIILSWMVQSRPKKVANCVFLDPICFQLHLADTLFNFHMTRVDRNIQAGKAWENPFSIGSLINLAGTEMHTNFAMLRRFSWATNSLWPCDLTRNGISASVLLSENDEIVPTTAIAELVSSTRRNTALPLWEDVVAKYSATVDGTFTRSHIMPEASHGEFAFNDIHREKVVKTVLAMMRLDDIRKKKRKAGISFSLPQL